MKKFILLNILLLSRFTLPAQELDPVKWTHNVIRQENNIRIVFTANIEDGWYLYGQELADGGPIPTSFHFETDGELLFPKFAEEKSEFIIENYDEMFGMNLKKFKQEVVFTYTLKTTSKIETIKGYLEYMCCDSTQCLAPKIIEFNLKTK